MANMLDYLTWRGDLRFSQAELNDVDGLILSELAYIRYEGLVSENISCGIPLRTLAKNFLELPEPMGRCRTERELELLKAAGESERFGHLEVSFYRSVFVPEEETQFAAMTFTLEDGTAFLAFRGTDDSLVGWKEDFNMAFQKNVPAQRLAQEYVQRYAAATQGAMRLGGHSKGGNLAVYAGAKCGELVQPRITQVYNYDGPGFMEEMLATPGYQAIVPRISTVVPQFSVFGMMLERSEAHKAIFSDASGLMQHEPFSWQVLGKDFVPMEDVTEGAYFLDRTLTAWLEGMSNQERRDFIEWIFEILMQEKVSQPKDLLRPQNLLAALRTIRAEHEKRQMSGAILQGLLESAKNARQNS